MLELVLTTTAETLQNTGTHSNKACLVEGQVPVVKQSRYVIYVWRTESDVDGKVLAFSAPQLW